MFAFCGRWTETKLPTLDTVSINNIHSCAIICEVGRTVVYFVSKLRNKKNNVNNAARVTSPALLSWSVVCVGRWWNTKYVNRDGLRLRWCRFSPKLRSMCHCLYQVVSQRFQQSPAEAVWTVVGTVIFLRFINPAIGTINNSHYYYYYSWYLYCASSQVATQLWNGATNALNKLLGVEQISFEFVSEYSLWHVWSSQLGR